MLEDEYSEISKELSSLKEERNELEKKLNLPHSKEFIIECKFDIIKIDEKIPVLEDKLKNLNIQIQEEKRKQLEEERRRKQEELDYKKIYITLTEYMSLFIRVFNITDLSNKSIEYLLNNYTKQQLFRIIDLSNFLDFSVFDNFIKDVHTNNAPLNILLDKYENKCNFIENLKPIIKNKIKKVENKWDLKFNGVIRRYYFHVEFVKDFSQEIELESYIINNFKDYVYSQIEYYLDDNEMGIDVDGYWERLSEYDKLDFISVNDFCEFYADDLYNEIKDVVEQDFDFEVDIKIPKNRKSIFEQTSKYKNWKKKKD